jgi:RNA polymerase sigma-70 factor (ECF subfamily)
MQSVANISFLQPSFGILSLIESMRIETHPQNKIDSETISEQLDRGLEQFYSRIFQAISAYTTGTGLDPADLTQETFLKAYRYRDTFQGDSAVYTWLFRIARNTCIDAMRKIKRTTGKIVDAPFEESWFNVENDQSEIEVREDTRLLKRALSKLDEELRLLIIMKDLQGMKYDEISEITEVNEGTIKSRLFRARLQLKKELIKLGYTS